MPRADPIFRSAHSVTHSLDFGWPGFGHAPLSAAQGEAGTLAFRKRIHTELQLTKGVT
jgi:hypothetical protein